MARTLALLAVLFGVYASTIGMDAFRDSDYGGDEPHYLLAAESLKRDHDVDVNDEYVAKAYAAFYPYELDQHGAETDGRLNEPHGVGFPLFILPAYLLGGAHGVELFLALVAAIAIALAYRLALRVVPDPWAISAALVVGLSPPFIAYGTAIYPELTAGAVLAGAALLALRLDERPRRREAFVCFALLGFLPWLGTKFVPAGVVIGVLAARGLWRARRRTLAVGSVEVALFSVTLYVAINEAIYGGVTPYTADSAGETATDASFPAGYANRAYRLVALFIDREYGLLRWAPVFALVFAGLWWLWRFHREGLSRALADVRQIELTGGLCALVLAVQLLVAGFLAPTMFGFWFPPRHLLAALPLAIPLVALGLRHAPKTGAALAALTFLSGAWVYADARFFGGALVAGRPDAPFGPLTGWLPDFNTRETWPFALAGAIGGVALLHVAREAHHSRQTAGATRTRYSG